jgi:rhodanese-related sulfurtransferase
MAQIIEFAGNHPYLVGALLGLTAVVVVTEIRYRAGGAQVAPAEAVKLINAGATVLDTRPAEQFLKGHIIGSVNIPADQLAGKEASVAKKKDRPVILCCETGMSSGRAASLLQKAGFSAVLRLKGGLVAWEREQLPLERQQPKNRKKKQK